MMRLINIPYAPPSGTEDLFLSKICSVVLAGEVDTISHQLPPVTLEEQNHETRLHLAPKDSSTAKHDITAARFFYQQCQMLGVPLTVVNDEVGFVCKNDYVVLRHSPFRHDQAAKTVAIPSSFYDELAEGDVSHIGSRLREV